MDRERFDTLTRLLATPASRRAALALLLGAGAASLLPDESDAKRRGGASRKAKRRRRQRLDDEAVTNTCAALCQRLFPQPGPRRDRCLAQAQANRVACECPSFCRSLYPRQPLRQLRCLAEALAGDADSLCLACGADPERACPQPDGGYICCAAEETCEAGSCGGGCPSGWTELSGDCALPCAGDAECLALGGGCTKCAQVASSALRVCVTFVTVAQGCASAGGEGCTVGEVCSGGSCWGLCEPPAA